MFLNIYVIFKCNYESYSSALFPFIWIFFIVLVFRTTTLPPSLPPLPHSPSPLLLLLLYEDGTQNTAHRSGKHSTSELHSQPQIYLLNIASLFPKWFIVY